MSGQSATVAVLGRELHSAAEIRQALREHDDPALILDMIEGSTNFHEAIAAVVEEIAEDEILFAGLEAKEAELGERKARIGKSIETRRQIILLAMDKAGVPTSKGPLATLSVRPTPPKVIVTNEAEIPAAFFIPQDPKLDKKALLAALKDGPVQGAELSNGGLSLSIRKA